MEKAREKAREKALFEETGRGSKKMEEETEVETSLAKFFQGMFAGAVAGAVGKTSTAPIDRIKMIYQVRGILPPSQEVKTQTKGNQCISRAGG